MSFNTAFTDINTSSLQTIQPERELKNSEICMSGFYFLFNFRWNSRWIFPNCPPVWKSFFPQLHFFVLVQSLHRRCVPKGVSQLLPLQVKVQLLRLGAQPNSAACDPQLQRWSLNLAPCVCVLSFHSHCVTNLTMTTTCLKTRISSVLWK